ncbi:acyltransferase family protein [Pedobacter sp.]|uniref:acyltransferase family protein n=1 Tax=Pedobacter sp. TaxID=1411316 RepID=UPI003D7F45D9
MIPVKNHVEWIDILKGFLLISICLSHFGYVPDIVRAFISPTNDVRIPCFFFLSGMLFSTNRHKTFLTYTKAKIKALLIPYCALFILFLILDWNLYLKPIETLKIAVENFLISDGPPKASPLWFVFTLFLLSILYFIIHNLFQNKYLKLLILSVTSGLGYYLSISDIDLPFRLDVVLSSLIFFGMGNLLRPTLSLSLTVINKKYKVLGWLLFISLMITSRIASFFNPNSVIGLNQINNYWLFHIMCFSGISSLILLCSLSWHQFSKFNSVNQLFRILQYIAKCGLPILAAHCFTLIIVDAFLIRTLGNSLLNIQFILKLIILVFSMYYITIPLLFSKLYFIFPQKRKTWHEAILIS